MKKVELELVVEGRELYLKAHGRIQKVKPNAEAATRKTIETLICDEEAEVCFDDIDDLVTDHGAKSEEAFELLYELVEDSEVTVSLNPRNVSGSIKSQETRCINTHSRPIEKSGIQEY